jgi:hypothetical protein
MANKSDQVTGTLDGTTWTEGDYVLELAPYKKMRAVIRFQEVAASGDIRAVMGECTKMITAWPHAGSPDDLESYLDLDVSDWREVQDVVIGAVTNFLEGETGGNQ